MKPYLKRLAVLYHKRKIGEGLSETEQIEWYESLNANMNCKNKERNYEETLAYLWGQYSKSGYLCSIERQLWEKAMNQNLWLACEISLLENLSLIVYQIGDVDFQHAICRRLQELGESRDDHSPKTS